MFHPVHFAVRLIKQEGVHSFCFSPGGALMSEVGGTSILNGAGNIVQTRPLYTSAINKCPG